MRIKQFTQVFNFFPMIDDATVHHLEATFLDTKWGFLWDVSQRNVKVMNDLVEGITQYDFGLEEGEVKSLITSLGTRMVVIGTPLGNVVLHERQRYQRVEEKENGEEGQVMVIAYYPAILENLLGTRAIQEDQLYRFTGFFNSKNNIGFTLKALIENA